jgi:hypothetical protein
LTIVATTSGRRPSLMFGTHSMIAIADTMVAVSARRDAAGCANSLTDRGFCSIIAAAFSRHPID